MAKVLVMQDYQRKNRPEEAATKNNLLKLSVPQSEENETYIFSERVDKHIDRSIPLFLVCVIGYFVAQAFRFFLS